jgi:DNA-binding NarL/FixJ family response regulator
MDRDRQSATRAAPSARGVATSDLSPSVETIIVAIVDDNRLVRDALAEMLNRLPDLRAVATNVVDAEFLAQTKPHVLFLDVGLGDEDSLNLVAALTRDAPDVKVVVMDIMPMHEDIVQYVNAGVAGFMLKDATFDEFAATVRAVFAGEKALPRTMTESLFSQIAIGAAARGREQALDDVRMTRREREVIDLIAEGLSNKEIAQRLNIAAHTVKSHVRNVMEKLTLHTRLQIAAFARREGAG